MEYWGVHLTWLGCKKKCKHSMSQKWYAHISYKFMNTNNIWNVNRSPVTTFGLVFAGLQECRGSLQKVRENLFPVKYCDGKEISFSNKVSCHRVTRITYKRLSSPENNSIVDRVLQSKYRENYKVIEKKTVAYMFLKKNILRLQKEEKKYMRVNLYEKPRIFLFSCNVSTLYRIFLSGLVLCCS